MIIQSVVMRKLEKSKPTGGDDSTKSPYLVHYRLNGSAKDSSDNGFHGKWEGKEDYAEGGARFDGSSRIVVNALKKYKWGDKFSVGVWFKRTSSSHFQVMGCASRSPPHSLFESPDRGGVPFGALIGHLR